MIEPSHFFRYCRSLKFSQAPDYDYLKNIFKGCMARNHLKEDGIFDWSPKDSIPIENKDFKQKLDLGYPTKTLEEGKAKVRHSLGFREYSEIL